MRRFDDWPERLDQFVAGAIDKYFEWGSFDCCLFSCDAVLAITGVDLAADFRGSYSSELGAARLLAKYRGVEGIAWKVAAEHSILEVPVLMAQRGDIVIMDGERGPTLGIVAPHGDKALFLGVDGMAAVELSKCRKAWRI
jgi:hypothetical protein